MVKRAFDLAGGALALALASPVMLLCAIAVWLDSGGPVTFTHDRLGLNGKPFRMLKFRSMYRNAADLRNPDGSTFNAQGILELRGPAAGCAERAWMSCRS